MKKLLLPIIAITLFACSKDEVNCNCPAEYLDTEGKTWVVQNTPINCETERPIKETTDNDNYAFIGCTDRH